MRHFPTLSKFAPIWVPIVSVILLFQIAKAVEIGKDDWLNAIGFRKNSEVVAQKTEPEQVKPDATLDTGTTGEPSEPPTSASLSYPSTASFVEVPDQPDYVEQEWNSRMAFFDRQGIPSSPPDISLFMKNNPAGLEYRNMQVDLDSEFFFNAPWPDEVKNLDSISIQPMVCDGPYYYDLSIGFYKVNKDLLINEPMTDPVELWFFRKTIEDIAAQNDRYLAIGFMGGGLCKTQEGRIIGYYGLSLKGGGAGEETYWGYLQDDYQLVPLVTLQSLSSAYFSCKLPVTLTKNNTLYINCGGEWGYGASQEIRRVDLNTASVDVVWSCYLSGYASLQERGSITGQRMLCGKVDEEFLF